MKKLAKQDVSEDEIKELEDKVQKMTDKYIKEIDGAIEVKIQRNSYGIMIAQSAIHSNSALLYRCYAADYTSRPRLEKQIFLRAACFSAHVV